MQGAAREHRRCFESGAAGHRGSLLRVRAVCTCLRRSKGGLTDAPSLLEGNRGGARLLLLELRKALPSSRNSAAFRQGPLGPGPAEHVRGLRSA